MSIKFECKIIIEVELVDIKVTKMRNQERFCSVNKDYANCLMLISLAIIFR